MRYGAHTAPTSPARVTVPWSSGGEYPGGPLPEKGSRLISAHAPKKNHLLAALPEERYLRLLPELELVAMPLGWVLYESGGRGSRSLAQEK